MDWRHTVKVGSDVALGVVIAMIAADLFYDPKRRSYASMPEADALTERGALQEAALVGLRFDSITSSVGLLFDLRGAIQLRDELVAVLIARGVTRLEWVNDHRRPGRIWHAVTGSIPDNQSGRFSLLLGFAPDAELRLEADAAEFFVGDMPGMDQAPPNFVEDDEDTIRLGMPSWAATFTPNAATFLDPEL
jgi:hypothetical protein